MFSHKTPCNKTTNLVIKSCVVQAGSWLIKKGSFNTVPGVRKDTENQMCLSPLCKMNVCDKTVHREAPHKVQLRKEKSLLLGSDENLALLLSSERSPLQSGVSTRQGVYKQSFGMQGENSSTCVDICYRPTSKFAFVCVL